MFRINFEKIGKAFNEIKQSLVKLLDALLASKIFRPPKKYHADGSVTSSRGGSTTVSEPWRSKDEARVTNEPLRC